MPLDRSSHDKIWAIKDAVNLALFKAGDNPLNEKHFCGYFIEAFELFFSSGLHECIFIMDSVRFHKTNRVQTMLQENGRRGISLPPYSPFLNQIENLLPKWNKIVKPAPRDQKPTYLI
ncbi:hypothetical protein RF11_14945 [Thelohanellus kitauei]|uniref:Tc1-like transposase DDE domain-containing protein n=1 Tax=Thelohanellus kitauei TaxID=669202 RepID=A0A0C2N363_THEKT|nr:hypothetical protein RF11_14945 [Thelohanellus kitauei]